MRLFPLLLVVLLAGCTAATPPPSAPAGTTEARLDDGTRVTLDPAERTLTVGDEQVAAGIGPTEVAVGAGGRVYVTDTGGRSVLLFRTRPRLKLWRRSALPGRPTAGVLDRERGRLWVAVPGEVVRVTADGAPRIRPPRFPIDGRIADLAVDAATGDVLATGEDGETRRLHSPGT